MKIVVSKQPDVALAKGLNNELERMSHTPTLLLLSGGSALDILGHLNLQNFSSYTTIMMMDERCSSEPEARNFSQLRSTEFYFKAIDQGVVFSGPESESETNCDSLTQNTKQMIEGWYHDNSNGHVVAVAGIGPDGHTAGIFPNSEAAVMSSQELVVGYEVDPKQTKYNFRVTVTLNYLLNKIDKIFVYAVGNNKARTLELVVESKDYNDNLPASIYKHTPNTTLFTDVELTHI